MAASYVGLSTGAGAAGGLETLLARMRADEVLKQHQQQLQQQGDYQKGILDIQNRASTRADAAGDLANRMGELKLENLRQIMGDMGSGGSPQHVPNPDASEDPAMFAQPQGPDPSMSRMNNPLGRTRMQGAGLNPNETFGAVPQPPKPKGPEDFNAEESFYNGLARKSGYDDYKKWAAVDPAAFVKAKHQWAEESRIINPSQSSEPMVLVADPDNPGQSIYTPRSQAVGKRGVMPAGMRERQTAYHSTLDLVDQIEKLGDEIGWKGLGPIKGRIGRIGQEYLGVGDPREEQLRNKIDQLKAQASFQEGGKQFTGTEKEMLDNFLAGVNQNPRAVRARLQSFRASANRSLSNLGEGGGGATTTPAPGGNKSKVTVTSITEVK